MRFNPNGLYSAHYENSEIDEYLNNYFAVNVVADNDSGYALGSGSFLKGAFANVKAFPLSGSSFLGWYYNDSLVSTDMEYRFVVTENIALIAKFSPVEMYDLKLVAGVGGKITSTEGVYSVGTEIAVVAEADAGFRFKEWASTGGAFNEANNSYAWFTMPDTDVIVTASFETLTTVSHTIIATAGIGGSAAGGGSYVSNSVVTLTAMPNTNYTFDGWYENSTKIGGAGAVYSFAATTSRTLEARFTYSPANDWSGGSETTSSNNTPNINGTMIVDDDIPLAPASSKFLNPFMDVHEDDWYYDSVAYVYQNGLMVGTSTNPMLFSPNIATTRGMIVTILYRMAGSPDVSMISNPFDDVQESKWYADAVMWAAENGIVSGYGDGKFGPDDNVTRQDLTVMLNNYAVFAKLTLPILRGYPGFVDDMDCANYAKEAIERFFSATIINGKPGNIFDPKSDATRAEIAAMLNGFIEVVEKSE
jgi:hypothetical protein